VKRKETDLNFHAYREVIIDPKSKHFRVAVGWVNQGTIEIVLKLAWLLIKPGICP
jgi:hypothetical protein